MSASCLDEETVTAFVGGHLSADLRAAAELHIDSCRTCERCVAEVARIGLSPDLRTEPVHGRTPARSLPRGTEIDRYTVLCEVGRGAMSVVYEAYDPRLDRRIAVKLLSSPARTRAPHGPEADERTLAEARAMARLSHPNVLAVHDAGTAHGLVFIAMELVDGITLGAWLRRERPTVEQIVDQFVRAGRGLAAAHAAGLVHRDFKPDNVLVGRDGRVLVTDFGLARVPPSAFAAVDRGSISSSRTGEVVGTPAYMSPEQLAGQSDAPSDQFSYCVALYEALAGQRPFLGNTLDELAQNVRGGEIRGALSPAWLDRAVRRGLDPDPGRRFPSMAALLDVLERGAQPRRWQLAAGIALVVAAGSLALASRVSGAVDHRQSPCAGATDRIAGAWGDQQRQAAQQAFAATGVAYAGDAWRAVADRLDGYAASWSLHQTDACEQGRSGQRSPEWNALADECYSDRLRSLSALVDLLGEADAAAVERATEAAARLPPIEDCAQADRLEQWAHRSRDPATVERWRALADEIARGRAMIDIGRYRDALATLGPLADEALELEDAHSESTAASLMCAIHHQLGSIEDAELACHRAAIVASGAGDAAAAARAWAYLVGIVAANRGRYVEAELWARYARASLERAGSPEVTEAALELSLGVLAKQRARYEEARRHYLRALHLHERVFGQDDLRVARTINNLAILEGTLGEVDASIHHHDRALAIKTALLGDSHPDVAVSLLNLGLIESKSERYDAARIHLERAQSVAQRALPADHPTLGIVLINLGLLEYRVGRPNEARPLLERAIAIMSAKQGERHPHVAAAVDNLGLVLAAMGELDHALSHHDRALAIQIGALGANHPNNATTHENRGDVLARLGRHREAVAAYRRALAVRERAEGTDPADLVRLRGLVAGK